MSIAFNITLLGYCTNSFFARTIPLHIHCMLYSLSMYTMYTDMYGCVVARLSPIMYNHVMLDRRVHP